MDHVCVICGKGFTGRPSRKYCSQRCSTKGNRYGIMIKQRSSIWKRDTANRMQRSDTESGLDPYVDHTTCPVCLGSIICCRHREIIVARYGRTPETLVCVCGGGCT